MNNILAPVRELTDKFQGNNVTSSTVLVGLICLNNGKLICLSNKLACFKKFNLKTKTVLSF